MKMHSKNSKKQHTNKKTQPSGQSPKDFLEELQIKKNFFASASTFVFIFIASVLGNLNWS